MAFQQHSPGFAIFERSTLSLVEESDSFTHHQWPWRSFAFASDMGTVGYLVNQPKLGLLGWLIALPYYIYGLYHQPNRQKRKEELVYQSTANGILPLLEAKVGAMLGEFTYGKPRLYFLEKSSNRFIQLTKPVYKTLGGFLALAFLTPTIGDPISKWLLNQYQQLSIDEGLQI